MKNTTLKNWQKYLALKSKERGFDNETAQDVLLLMIEEIGELARAIRKQVGIKADDKSIVHPLEDELADIFAYALHMSNVLNVDLEEAIIKKEEKNNKRTWK